MLAGTHGPGRTVSGNWSWVRIGDTSPTRAPIWNATKEAEWRKLVLGWAARGGWRFYFTWRSDHSPAGFPDLVLCKPPRLLIIELKRERRHPTPAQREWMADLRACGLQVEVWYPHDEERVRAILLEGAA